MTRALQKHVARRQDQTFADWFAELRELAGERWADVADQAPNDLRGLGRRCDAGASLVHGRANSPAEDSGGIITSPCRVPGRGFSRIGGANDNQTKTTQSPAAKRAAPGRHETNARRAETRGNRCPQTRVALALAGGRSGASRQPRQNRG